MYILFVIYRVAYDNYFNNEQQWRQQQHRGLNYMDFISPGFQVIDPGSKSTRMHPPEESVGPDRRFLSEGT